MKRVLLILECDTAEKVGKAREVVSGLWDELRAHRIGATLAAEAGPFNEFPESQVRGLFALAGIEIARLYEIRNRYWPDTPEYRVLRASSPWWLVETPHGIIVLGWRKRVLHVEWEGTIARGIVTQDNVTKGVTYVHAWDNAKAVEYLTELGRLLRKGEVDAEGASRQAGA